MYIHKHNINSMKNITLFNSVFILYIVCVNGMAGRWADDHWRRLNSSLYLLAAHEE